MKDKAVDRPRKNRIENEDGNAGNERRVGSLVSDAVKGITKQRDGTATGICSWVAVLANESSLCTVLGACMDTLRKVKRRTAIDFEI